MGPVGQIVLDLLLPSLSRATIHDEDWRLISGATQLPNCTDTFRLRKPEKRIC